MDLDAPLRGVFAGLPRVLLAELGEERVLELAEEPGRLEAVFYDVISEATETAAHELEDRLKRDGPEMLARRRAETRGFEERLARRWARAFDLAEMVMVIAYEAGEAFNEKHRFKAEADNDLTFAVLVRLHARACRIAEEVLTLLKAGFGQAALARWRVLHEVAVVSSFISRHDRDTAERYLLHENIESRRAMEELQARVDRLDAEPIAEEELRETKETVDELVSRYGNKYAAPYGWAHKALVEEDPKYAKERITFSVIEKVVSLDHLRPYYRMASHGTHANPKGILFTPDLLNGEPEVLLAGPGSTGLADPGQCALISLNLVTATLLMYRTGESAPLVLTALLRLVDEAANAYVETQRAVDNGEDRPHYGPIARFRYRATPQLAVARQRARRLVAKARSTVRSTGTTSSAS